MNTENPRLWPWENRLKLLLLATLDYAFLLSLAKFELDLISRPSGGKRLRVHPDKVYVRDEQE